MQKKQLEACAVNAASTKSDAQGHYEFSKVEPGWYSLSMVWPLSKKPQLGLWGARVRNDFFIMNGELKETPGKYVAVAVQVEPFRYAEREAKVLDLTDKEDSK